MTELTRDFYRTDGLTLARALIGKTLVHCLGGVELCGIITETEAYMGVTDRASHAFGGRRTPRTETMYLDGGHAYVYRIYGLYWCMNVTASRAGNPEAVLLRAVFPAENAEAMAENVRRTSRRKHPLPPFGSLSEKERYALSDGPGKLCLAMAITGALNGCDLCGGVFRIRDDGWRAREIRTAPRIGIDYAGEAKEYPWRFTASLKNGVPELLRENA